MPPLFMPEVTPSLLLQAYAHGYFPMAETATATRLHWFDPPQRGVLPLETFHVPRRLARTVRRTLFAITADRAFAGVIEACAAPRPGHPGTWINRTIRQLYTRLHAQGFAHSVECWDGEQLAGGLYGVALGGAFFGESMFSRATDASKVALVHLVGLLRLGGFRLLDTQFMTQHLTQFGGVAIAQARYKRLLAEAIRTPATWRAEQAARAGLDLVGRGATE